MALSHLDPFEALCESGQFMIEGIPSRVEECASQRREFIDSLSDIGSSLERADFGECHGIVFEVLRPYPSLKLPNILAHCREGQNQLVEVIEFYGRKLGEAQTEMTGVRTEAGITHTRFNTAVDAYNAAEITYNSACLTGNAVLVAKTGEILQQAADAYNEVAEEWGELEKEERKIKQTLSDKVDNCLSAIAAAELPKISLKVDPVQGMSQLFVLEVSDIDNTCRSILAAGTKLLRKMECVADLEGADNLRGPDLVSALESIDALWEDYFAAIERALDDFVLSVGDFANTVQDVESANAHSHDSVGVTYKLPDRGSWLERNESTFKNVVVSGVNEFNSGLFGYAAHQAEKLGIDDFAKRATPFAGPVIGTAVDYVVARDEGYSRSTSFGAATVGAFNGTVAGGATTALLIAAGMTGPVGIIGALAIGGLVGAYAANDGANHVKFRSDEVLAY